VYSVTYRVDVLGEDDRVERTTETRVVRRPFDSRVTTSDGEVTRAGFAYAGQQSGSGEPTVLTPIPAPSRDDVRGDLLVAAAGDPDGEVREVLGRRCRVLHFGAAVLDGEIVPGEITDTCVDADGIVLEEVVRDGDAISARWLATEVDVSAAVADADFRFDGAVAVPADQGGGSVRAVEPTSRSLGTFYELPSPPEGFTHLGRYAVVPPQAANPDDIESRAQVLAGVVDVFVRGVDVVVIEQGGTLGQVPPFGAHPHATVVDGVGALGDRGESFLTPTGAEVRVLVPPGRYVRVYGTVTVDDLVAILRALEPVEGGGLVYR
jgi:hypothetical protein